MRNTLSDARCLFRHGYACVSMVVGMCMFLCACVSFDVFLCILAECKMR